MSDDPLVCQCDDPVVGWTLKDKEFCEECRARIIEPIRRSEQ